MTNTTMVLVLFAVAGVIAVGSATRLALAGPRARRRAAWELDRVEWRRSMTRP
jgi:hypothetical protein